MLKPHDTNVNRCSEKMPQNLNKYLSGKISAADILKIFGSIRTARTAPPDIRAGVIKAYDDTVRVMYLPALILCKFFFPSTYAYGELTAADYTGFVPFIVAFFTQNFFLGDTHNAVENKKIIADLQEDPVIHGDQEAMRTHVAPVVEGREPDVKVKGD
jgi:hypothetical protein